MTLRYAAFMLKGLAETEESLRRKHIPFHLLTATEPRGDASIRGVSAQTVYFPSSQNRT